MEYTLTLKWDRFLCEIFTKQVYVQHSSIIDRKMKMDFICISLSLEIFMLWSYWSTWQRKCGGVKGICTCLVHIFWVRFWYTNFGNQRFIQFSVLDVRFLASPSKFIKSIHFIVKTFAFVCFMSRNKKIIADQQKRA